MATHAGEEQNERYEHWNWLLLFATFIAGFMHQ